MRSGPPDQNTPGYIILYHPTARVVPYLETVPIQEGALADYGQAHLTVDQDGMDSYLSGNIGAQVNNESESASSQPEVNRSPIQGQLVHGGLAPNGDQSLLITTGVLQATPSPDVTNTENLPTTPSYVDDGLQLHIGMGPCAQSVSGFSDTGMNEPSDGHLAQLEPDPGVAFPPNNQALDRENDDIRRKHEQVRKQLLGFNIGSDVINEVVNEFGLRSLESRAEFFKYLDLKEERQRRGAGCMSPRPEFAPVETSGEQEGTIRPFVATPGPHDTLNVGPSNFQGTRTPGSSTYMTAQQQPSHRETLQPQDATQMQQPNYRDPQTRMQSFQGWPKSSPQSPERLTAAGLFYTGERDHCRCFCCGGLLREWERDDDPMKEHARWFPDCPFVKETNSKKLETVVKSPEGATGVIEQRMQDLSVEDIDASQVQILEDMGFARKDVIEAAKKIGKKADINDILDVLSKKPSGPHSVIKNAELSPEMDPNVCGVCNRDRISITQLQCRHIVCSNCAQRKGSDGLYRCGICGREVTCRIAYDSGAFN